MNLYDLLNYQLLWILSVFILSGLVKTIDNINYSLENNLGFNVLSVLNYCLTWTSVTILIYLLTSQMCYIKLVSYFNLIDLLYTLYWNNNPKIKNAQNQYEMAKTKNY